VLPADLPLVPIDSVLLEQAVVNLLENAARHTPPGTRVEVVARREGDGILLQVADHGPGLPPGGSERLFEKFVRGEGAAPGGSGLGLAIARAVLKHPDILIMSEATAALDGATQTTILRNVLNEFKGRALVWILHRPSQARGFDQVIVMKGGKIVEKGTFDDLAAGQTALADLIAAE